MEEHAMAEQRPSHSGGQAPAQERSPQGRDQAQERSPQGHDPAPELGTQLTETAQHVGETAAHYYDQGREQLSAVEGYLEDRIRAKPLQSIVIAAGVGMLFAFLWRR
jgi:ElaB/YqjD/DUF883 family membrane-anchored ribosome-binding protein